MLRNMVRFDTLPLADLLRAPGLRAATGSQRIVPQVVKFGGVLTDVSGKPLTGTVGVTFSLYKDQEGRAALDGNSKRPA